LLPSENGLRR